MNKFHLKYKSSRTCGKGKGISFPFPSSTPWFTVIAVFVSLFLSLYLPEASLSVFGWGGIYTWVKKAHVPSSALLHFEFRCRWGMERHVALVKVGSVCIGENLIINK